MNTQKERGPSRRGWALLLLAILVGALLRLWQPGDLPPGFYRDEAFNGLDALRVLNGGHALFFSANNGREPAYIYLTAVAITLFGRSVVAVRIGAAVVGAATTGVTYLLGKSWFNRRVGLLAAWLWAITLWPVHLSRIGLRPILLPFVLGAAFWLAALAYRRQERWLWLLAGAAYGAGFYTYLAVRFTPLLLLALVAYLWWRERERIWPGVLWFGVGTAVLLLPWLLLFWQQPELIVGRTGQVSILNPAINGGDLWGTLVRSIGRALGMFIWRGDTILRHNPVGRPVFDWLMALPFLVGVIWCLRHRRKPAAAALLLWVGVMLGPTILAEDTPHFLRAVGVLPAVLLLPAIGLAQVWTWSRLPVWLRRGGVLLLLAGSLLLTGRDYLAYSQDEAVALLFEAAALDLAQQIEQEGAETAVYLDRWFWDPASQRGWPSIPFLVDVDALYLYRPEFGVPPAAPGQPVTVYGWPFGSLDFMATFLQPPARVSVAEGPPARGDLEPESYPLYVRYHVVPGAVPEETAARFGDRLWLRSVAAAVDEQTLHVDLQWETETAVSRRWVAFVHVLGPDGLVAQSDRPPAYGHWLPQWWQPGIVVQDARTLALPVPFDPAQHQIVVGLYDPATAERLPVFTPDGRPVGDSWPVVPVIR